MIECKECKMLISNIAKTCPHCGAKTKKIHPVMIVVVFLAGVFVVSSVYRAASSVNHANKTSEELSGRSVGNSERGMIPTSNSEALKIKGFYIGMSIDEAVKLLNEKYKDVLLKDGTCNVSVLKGETPPFERPVEILHAYDGDVYCFDHFVSFNNEVHSPININADKSGKVIFIEFSQSAVDKLFNVEDMDAKSFSQAFMNNYSIPELAPCSWFNEFGGDIYAWCYTSDKGFKVVITGSKDLYIEKVASSKERKFD